MSHHHQILDFTHILQRLPRMHRVWCCRRPRVTTHHRRVPHLHQLAISRYEHSWPVACEPAAANEACRARIAQELTNHSAAVGAVARWSLSSMVGQAACTHLVWLEPARRIAGRAGQVQGLATRRRRARARARARVIRTATASPIARATHQRAENWANAARRAQGTIRPGRAVSTKRPASTLSQATKRTITPLRVGEIRLTDPEFLELACTEDEKQREKSAMCAAIGRGANW